MKHKLKFIAIIIALFAVFVFSKKEKTELRDLAFNNMEALANNEGGEKYLCGGIGSIDCFGHKVEYKYTGFSIGL